MSSPANRTALREEENRPAPPSQQVIASAVTGPTPYSRAARTLAPVRCRAASRSSCRSTFTLASRAVSRSTAAPGRSKLLSGIPPPGAPLHRERDAITAGERRQPGPQAHAVSRGDLTALDLTGHGVEIVESQLLPVDIQPACDRHGTSSSSRGRPSAPRELLTSQSLRI